MNDNWHLYCKGLLDSAYIRHSLKSKLRRRDRMVSPMPTPSPASDLERSRDRALALKPSPPNPYRTVASGLHHLSRSKPVHCGDRPMAHGLSGSQG